MDENKIIEAVRQVISFCDGAMKDYTPVSLRSVLYTLGYIEDEVTDVLQYVYDRGFNYCLDREFKNYGSNEYPLEDVCFWGPDQLKSRLDFVI